MFDRRTELGGSAVAKRMSLILFSGTVDKLLAAATLATCGTAIELEFDHF